ncbi:MAG: hypothetical protein JKX83_11070 [Pseudomonadales bacterium]|nr:hypothetical protein [Pseudomonadales bacterium]
MTSIVNPRFKTAVVLALATSLFSFTGLTQAQGNAISAAKARVIDHWTPERISHATPRDLLIDNRGLGYLRKADGSLQAYGHNTRPQIISSTQKNPNAKPDGKGGGSGGGGKGGNDGGGGSTSSDSTAPTITSTNPSDGATIGSAHTFSAVITDASGIKSVSFVVTYPNGTTTQSFTPANIGNDTWSTDLSGFSDGNWSWHVVAKDKGSKGGNTATSTSTNFTVSSSSGSGGTGDYVVTNAGWSQGDAVQNAAGRIYFEMPDTANRTGSWGGYVCSGTVTTDETSGRSIIITASHCVYDDANKAFARNVLFIPNQAGTTGSGTDLNCSNDPIGCWATSFGVVDNNWATKTFPNNIAWDYAYYVVNDSGAHSGATASSDSLDIAAGSLPVNFTSAYTYDGDPSATSIDFTHSLGYSYSEDPNFMYFAEDMKTEGSVNWWLANCGLSGGSSGGPWVQPMDEATGIGPIISVNSWGYTTAPGMAGPKLVGTSAECIYAEAKSISFTSVSSTDGDEGVVIDYCP